MSHIEWHDLSGYPLVTDTGSHNIQLSIRDDRHLRCLQPHVIAAAHLTAEKFATLLVDPLMQDYEIQHIRFRSLY